MGTLTVGLILTLKALDGIFIEYCDVKTGVVELKSSDQNL